MSGIPAKYRSGDTAAHPNRDGLCSRVETLAASVHAGESSPPCVLAMGTSIATFRRDQKKFLDSGCILDTANTVSAFQADTILASLAGTLHSNHVLEMLQVCASMLGIFWEDEVLKGLCQLRQICISQHFRQCTVQL